MGLPVSENFDGVTAPALPAGWNTTGSGWATTTSDSVSSPNAATISTSSSTKAYLTFGTADGNGGDAVIVCKLKDFSAVRPGTVGLTARGSAATLGATTSQYELSINWNTGVLKLSRVNGGAETSLATVSMVGGWDQWDTLTWKIVGSVHTVELQRSSDSEWLTVGGSWQVAETAAITFTDSSPLTGSGFFGLFSVAGASSNHQGWWDDFSATAPATVVYFADSGSSESHSFPVALGGDSGIIVAEAGTPTPLLWSYIQGTGSHSTGFVTSLAITFPANVTAGDLIVVGCTAAIASTAPTVTDSAGNTYTLAGSASYAGNQQTTALLYAIAGSSGPLTVTITPPASDIVVASIDEFAGDGSILFGVAASGIDGGTLGRTMSAGTITPSGTELIVAVGSLSTNHGTLSYPLVAGSDFTQTYNFSGGSSQKDQITEYQLNATSPVTPSASASSGANTNWGMVAASFRAGSATFICFADSGSGGDGSLRRGLAGESSGGGESSLLGSFDAGGSAGLDSSRAARLLGDMGTAGSSSLQTTFAGGTSYAYDSAAGSDRWLVNRLLSDSTAEAEAFLELFSVVDRDLGTAEDLGLATLLAGASTVPFELVGIVLTAPAPTAWAADAGLGGYEVFKRIVGGDLSGRGADDIGIGSEAWSSSTTLIAVDLGADSEAWRSFAVIAYAGYHVYANDGAGGPIDHSAWIAEIVGLDDLTWTTGRLSPGTWSYNVRAFNPSGEEQNVDVAATIVISGAGSDVSNIPAPPRALSAVAGAGGTIAIHWNYPIVSGPAAPTGFHVYRGVGTVDYSTPVATVAAGTAGVIGRYTATASGLADRTSYLFSVRAFNGTGEEANTLTASATARVSGPNAVQSLTIQATS